MSPFGVPAFRPWAHLAGFLLLAAAMGCSHPAEKALQGHWYGDSVENFDQDQIAAATGWAKGTSLFFDGNRLKVTVPAENPRSGIYRLSGIDDREVSLTVMDARGKESQLDLIVDDAKSLRWVLGEGRALVLKKQD